MKKNVAALVAVSVLAIPVLGFAEMADSNSVNSAAIINGAVATVDLANGAVTNAKVSDLAMTKVTGLTAALADKAATNHLHAYGNMTIVATSGGEYANPAAALADTATWCGTPSSSNPCLMRIMPGIYELGATTLAVPAYLDIEGSGKSNTTLTSNSPTNAAVTTSGSTLSNFSLVVTGNGGGTLSGILATGSNTLDGVGINISGAESNISIQANGGQGDRLSINNVMAHSHGQSYSSMLLGSVGIWILGGIEDIKVDNSTIIADNQDGNQGYGVSDYRNYWEPWAMRFVANNSKFVVNFLHNYTLKDYATYNPLYINSQVISKQGNYDYMFRCVNVFDANMAPMTCGSL